MDTPRNEQATIGARASAIFSRSGDRNTPGSGFVDPIISMKPKSLGRSVFYPLFNVFDFRTVQRWDISGSPAQLNTIERYSSSLPGYDANIMLRRLRSLYGQLRPGRRPPDQEQFWRVLNIICDVSRMLGIYYTGFALRRSRDPNLMSLADIVNLELSEAWMQTALYDLPLPRFLAYLNSKYVGLQDVSETQMYQNVGFLVVGGRPQFEALWRNVISDENREALELARLFFPELGQLGEPSLPTLIENDFLQVFINAHYKVSTTPEFNYVTVKGASDEPIRLASVGILSSHRTTVDGDNWYTNTGFAAPGWGYANDAADPLFNAQRIPLGHLSIYDPVLRQVRAISPTSDLTPTIIGTIYQFSTSVNAALCANMGHEYNMNADLNIPAVVVNQFDFGTGDVISNDTYTQHDTQYRVSSGYGLNKLTVDFDLNYYAMCDEIIFNNG